LKDEADAAKGENRG